MEAHAEGEQDDGEARVEEEQDDEVRATRQGGGQMRYGPYHQRPPASGAQQPTSTSNLFSKRALKRIRSACSVAWGRRVLGVPVAGSAPTGCRAIFPASPVA